MLRSFTDKERNQCRACETRDKAWSGKQQNCKIGNKTSYIQEPEEEYGGLQKTKSVVNKIETIKSDGFYTVTRVSKLHRFFLLYKC